MRLMVLEEIRVSFLSYPHLFKIQGLTPRGNSTFITFKFSLVRRTGQKFCMVNNSERRSLTAPRSEMHKSSGATCKFVHERDDGGTSRMMSIKGITDYLGPWVAFSDMSARLNGS
jgi:hypothetical protein